MHPDCNIREALQSIPTGYQSVSERVSQLDDNYYPDDDDLVGFSTIAQVGKRNPGDWVRNNLTPYLDLRPDNGKWTNLEGVTITSSLDDPELNKAIFQFVMQSKKARSMVQREEKKYRFLDLSITSASARSKKRDENLTLSINVRYGRHATAGMSFFMDISKDELTALQQTLPAPNEEEPPDQQIPSPASPTEEIAPV